MEEKQSRTSPVDQDPVLAEITAKALLRAFIVEQIERRRRPSGKLGFAQLDYGRLFVRDRWTLFAIARELGCTIEELIEPPVPASESRVVWGDLVEASDVVMGAARSLREPIRQVTLLRAAGLGWRKIQRALPGRASFSLAEDYVLGIERVAILAGRECRLLAFSEHPKFFVVKSTSTC